LFITVTLSPSLSADAGGSQQISCAVGTDNNQQSTKGNSGRSVGCGSGGGSGIGDDGR